MGPISPLHQRPLLLLSSRLWNSALADRLSRQFKRPVVIIAESIKLTSEAVAAIDPQLIFMPHWSHLIPESIWGSRPTVDLFRCPTCPMGGAEAHCRT